MTVWNSEPLQTIPELLRHGAEAAPEKIALYIGEDALTYAELVEKSLSAAVGLHHLGVGRGDAVSTLMSNSTEQLFTMLGCAWLGAVYAPINADYKGEFLRHQLAVSRSSTIVVDADLALQIERVVPDLPELRHVVVRGELPTAPAGGGPAWHPAGDALLGAGTELRADLPTPQGGDVAAVIFTAGTTGPSKGVAMSQNYLCRSAQQVFDIRGGTPDSVVYAALPLFHLAAISLVVLGPISRFATGALDNRFSPNNYWDRVRRFEADQSVMLGSMSTMLWNRPEQPDDADNPLRVAAVAPMPPAIHRQFEERFGMTVLQLYAQSEAYPLTIAPASAPAPPGYSGKVNPLFTVKLFDENSAEVAVGETGEVVVRPNAPHVMFEGYYNDPAGTAAVWRNGWMHTGDLGRFNEEGYFAFVDRKKDYLRRRGENISSFEVERAAMSYPGVAEVAIVAAPSEVTEDDVAACVVLAPDAGEFDCARFLDHCAENMPYFAVPRYVWVVPDLPRNPVGRVQKYKLRESLQALPAEIDGLWDSTAHGYAVRRRIPVA